MLESCGELLSHFRNFQELPRRYYLRAQQARFPHFPRNPFNLYTSLFSTYNSLKSQTHQKLLYHTSPGKKSILFRKGWKKPPHQLSDLIKITQHAATEVGLSTASFSLPVNPAENNSEIQKQCETVPNNNHCFMENSSSLTLYKN